jgi:predicted cupin superfamily sugar epimerase
VTAADAIRLLNLQPHPVEGGHFRETHRTAATLSTAGGARPVGTAIYYLLTGDAVSELHRLPGDEVYHFYAGDPLETLHLRPDGSSEVFTVGGDLLALQVPQLVVPGGVWQGSRRVNGQHGFTLIGATMAPGFDYADYETGDRATLAARWPGHAALIEALTPKG